MKQKEALGIVLSKGKAIISLSDLYSISDFIKNLELESQREVSYHFNLETLTQDVVRGEMYSSSAKILVFYEVCEDNVSDTYKSLADIKTKDYVILIQNKSLGKSKAANSLKNDYDSIKLDKPTAAEVKTFIKTKLESFGRLYNSEVIDCIYKKRDNDLYGIASDLEKIKHYCKGKDVTLRDCELLVEDNSYKTFFSLTEKVMLLSKKEIFRDLSKFSETEYIPIVTTIIKSLDKLYKVLCLREEGKDLEDIAVLTGTPKFILKTKFVPNINILGRKGILYMKDNLLNLDVRLRSSKLDKRLIMESGLIKCFPAKV